MKTYTIHTNGMQKRIVADTRGQYLAWPSSGVPFIDNTRLEAHPRKDEITTLMDAALGGGKTACDALWQDTDVLAITWSLADVS